MTLPVNMAAMTSARQPQRQHPSIETTSEGERLAKRVAELVPCSRREAEQYIEGGWVKVNGVVVEEPMHRVKAQQVEVDPNASLIALLPVTLLLHKPPGFEAMAELGHATPRVKPAHQLLQAANHFADDLAGTRVLKRHFAKLTPTVPLEPGASGLVVFTQDWRVARKLTEDAAVIEQELLVEVAGEVNPVTLDRIARMKGSRGQALPPIKVSLNSTAKHTSKLRFAIKGIHLGLIAYVCDCSGLAIVSMKRLRIGRVSMTQMPEGHWRYLQAHERF